MVEVFDFSKQPITPEGEVEWLRNTIWHIHITQMVRNEKYRGFETGSPEKDYIWLPFFTACIAEYEKCFGVTLTSGWYLVMREYWHFPEAWNSLPFKLKIDRDWGAKIYG